MMEIETRALTGREITAVSLNQVGALAMTLPALIDKALQTR